ncbi:MAG: nucleotidyltransferase family protein [Methanomicrobia archaeon]|nr:nucleotidyltransferase family protein [Methanomicrobia archaeon]
MREEQLKELKTAIVAVLKQHEVKKAALFGSFARGEATEESDIDLLVEFEGRKSLLDLAGLQLDLQDTVKRQVDVLTYNSLHPLLKDRILREQVMLL